MIAIAQDHIDGLTLMPFAKEILKAIGRCILADIPAVERFVHNQKAHLIAQVQQFGRHQIMAATDGVAAHGL
ncbi:MAG: hypothetical protein BWY83_00942 [bacterium ADurb.Bin478]|nr:MAG: hypothetical protein BWY83_00942 [bacterium ADurb.Bin478]